MTRNLIGMSTAALFLTMGAICGAVEGNNHAPAEGPWRQVIYGNDGQVVAASGLERPGVPLMLTSDSTVRNDRLITRVTYQRGSSTLNIERTFDGSTGVDTIYETADERLFVSLFRDNLTGESLVVYRLPDGGVYSLWMTEDGEILSGDIEGLRRSLQKPNGITRLLKSYVRHKRTFASELPDAGEQMLMPIVTCEDGCAGGCNRQCALECAFGTPFCKICKISCAIGCIIGCSG